MDNNYHRKYNLERYYRVKEKAIEYLGGVCKNCGSSVQLEFDHIVSNTKDFDIGSKMLSMSFDNLVQELNKCQLLCRKCHIQRHSTAKNTHGTLSSWRYCKCDVCREAYNSYMRAYKKNKRNACIV